MNPRLKIFLVACGYILLFVSAIGAMALFFHLLELLSSYLLKILEPFFDTLYAFLFAKTSSEVLATLALVALCVVCITCCLISSIFTEKITSSYQSFKNENADGNIFSEVYNDPTVGLKDKILFFSIHLMYYIQLPLLYCALKISILNQWLIKSNISRIIPGTTIVLILINTILLVPVALLELVKYPLVKLFSPLGLNVKQFSFLFNVSDVGTSSQSVHTRSFQQSVIECAKKLKEEHGTPLNELDEEFKSYISGLTSQQKRMIEPYLRLDGYETGEWVNWVDSQTGLTLTQAINLVLIAAREQNADVELLKSILLVRFEESNRQCGPGMLLRIIYALSGLEAENNFAAQLEPQQIGELFGNATKRFFERSVDKHYYKIKVLKENFDNLYSLSSGVDLSNVSDEVKDGISYTRNAIKEFVFKELYVKFYNDYGEHIRTCLEKKKGYDEVS